MPDSPPSSPTPLQAQAWIHALTPGEDARLVLAQTLAEGVNPWVPSAVVRQWRTLSVSMPEAVMLATDALGDREVRERMVLLSRHTPQAQTLAQRQASLAVAQAMLGTHFPVREITAWVGKAGALSLEEARKVATTALEEALSKGGEWGGEAVGWIHRRVLTWDQWTSEQVERLESCEDSQVRDAYWRMLRDHPLSPDRPLPGPGGRRAP